MVKQAVRAICLSLLAFFIAILPLFQVGSLIWHKHQMKQHAKHALKHSDEVSTFYFKTKPNDHEFEFQQKKYDIVSIQKKDNGYIVVALEDKFEKELEKQIDAQNKKNAPHSIYKNIDWIPACYSILNYNIDFFIIYSDYPSLDKTCLGYIENVEFPPEILVAA